MLLIGIDLILYMFIEKCKILTIQMKCLKKCYSLLTKNLKVLYQ